MSLIIQPGGGAPGIPQPVILGGPPATFPDFTPIIPPPLIGEGGGPPPQFPPPTPPPIGDVPIGPLVGPEIAPAAVPPSVAGIVQPEFATGSATSPPGYFPEFTTTFPVPPIVFSNLFMNGTAPPQTPSTLNIVPNGWGLFVPPGAPGAPGSDGRLPRLDDPPPENARRRRRKPV